MCDSEGVVTYRLRTTDWPKSSLSPFLKSFMDAEL